MTSASQTIGYLQAVGGRLVFVAGLLLGASVLAPAAEQAMTPEFLLQSWDVTHGLPSGKIQAVAQTPEGYWWIASSNGLIQFDGVRFVCYNTNNAPVLKDSWITCLLVTRAGELWAGTGGGFLTRRRNGVFEAVPLGLPGRKTKMNALAEGPDGAVWIGTGASGVARWRQTGCDWFTVTDANNISCKDVTQIVADRQGRLWAVADEKLATFENGVWKIASGIAASGQRRVMSVSPAQDGGLWVAACSLQTGLSGRGTQVFKLDHAGWAEPHPHYPWQQDSVLTRPASLLDDQAGHLWLTLFGLGPYVVADGGKWQSALGMAGAKYFKPARNAVLAAGREGVIWGGDTNLILISEAARPLVATISLPPPAKDGFVLTAVCVRRDGSVWMGTDGSGAYSYRPGEISEGNFAQKPDSFQKYVNVLYEDRQTNFWMGTSSGLYRWEEGCFQKASGHQNLAVLEALGKVVLSLNEDQRGNLWVGADAGIVRVGPDGDKLFVPTGAANHFVIRAIEVDRAGQIWAAVTGLGLCRKNGERFELCHLSRWAGETNICGLHADSDGALWIITDRMGLARVKDGKFTWWTVADGLPAKYLFGLIEDVEGNLWFSSDNGIFGCPKARLLSYERNLSPPVLFWHLTAADGLDSQQCSGAGQSSVARSPDGRLWFSDMHALAVFDPALKQRQQPFTIGTRSPVIEETLVDGAVLARDADGILRVISGPKSYEIHYTSPAYRSPERLEFRYRLKGIDAGWVAAGSRRTAYYSHLPAGRYVFQAQVGGVDGIWHPAHQELQLEIVPVLWERRWVRVAGALILLAAVAATVWSVSRTRMRRKLAILERQRALEQERSRIARDMHDEIGARLTQISLLSALANDSAGNAAEVQTQTKKISGVARNLTSSLDEMVWALRPQNDNLESLVDYLSESLRDLCEGSPVRYWFSGPTVVPAVEIPANVRHNVLLGCSEVVNNVLKHSGANAVRVRVQIEPRLLAIEIADNGTGFDVAKGEAKRSGLVHIRQRLEEIGGSCVCKSVPGEGTQFAFTVPIGAGLAAAAGKTI